MKFIISLFSAFSRAHTAAPSGCSNLFSFLKQSSSHILWEKSKKSWKNRYILAQNLVQSWPSGGLFLSKMWFLNLSLLKYVLRLTNETFSGRDYGHISFNSGQKKLGGLSARPRIEHWKMTQKSSKMPKTAIFDPILKLFLAQIFIIWHEDSFGRS